MLRYFSVVSRISASVKRKKVDIMFTLCRNQQRSRSIVTECVQINNYEKNKNKNRISYLCFVETSSEVDRSLQSAYGLFFCNLCRAHENRFLFKNKVNATSMISCSYCQHRYSWLCDYYFWHYCSFIQYVYTYVFSCNELKYFGDKIWFVNNYTRYRRKN